MKTVMLSALAFLVLSGCHAQEDNARTSQEENAVTTDTLAGAEPRVQWKVNKRVDEQGNIIGYDSLYSWSYSNRNGIPPEIDLDSLMQSFDAFPGHGITPFDEGDTFGFFSDPDSLWSRGGFLPREFLNEGHPQFEALQKIMQDMDSLQQLFLEQHRSPMIPRAEEEQRL